MNTPFRSVARSTSTGSLCKDERGLSTVEYVIILVLIAVSAVGIWKTFGETIVTKITNSNTKINGMDSDKGPGKQ